MTASANSEIQEVEARSVRFDGDLLFIELSDGRQIGLSFKKIKWLDWLAKATPEQREKWTIEPYGYAVWWDELDDGVEVVHLLSLQPLPHKQERKADQPVLTTI